ncbi:Hypothetical protein SMAX5B_007880, partial [Scophthalmus maximus]
ACQPCWSGVVISAAAAATAIDPYCNLRTERTPCQLKRWSGSSSLRLTRAYSFFTSAEQAGYCSNDLQCILCFPRLP